MKRPATAVALLWLGGSLVSLLATGVLGAGPLDARQQRGERIFLHGEGAAPQPLMAYLASAELDVGAAIVPCVQCHGRDGRGGSESGVDSADIRWHALSHAAPATADRQRPAYTDATLRRAITMGFDAAGTPLHPVMPRYRLSRADSDDLLAYLRGLGDYATPGVGDDELRIGVMPAPTAAGAAALQALAAWANEINAGGGIYHRQIRLLAIGMESTGPAGPPALAELEALHRREPLFALLHVDLRGRESLASAIEAWLIEQGLPVIGLWSDRPTRFADGSQPALLLSGGRQDLVTALLLDAEPGAPAVLVDAAIMASAEYAALVAQLKQHWPSLRVASVDDPDSIRRWADAEVDTVLLLATARQRARWLASLQASVMTSWETRPGAAGWSPRLLVPASYIAADLFALPPALRDQVRLGLPQRPPGSGHPRAADYHGLARRHQLPTAHRAAQWQALGEAELLLELLRRSGRNLDRKGLIESAYGLWNFDNGWLAPQRFDVNRHIGARGAWVSSLQPSIASRWIDIESLLAAAKARP